MTWLKIKDVAILMGMTERGVRINTSTAMLKEKGGAVLKLRSPWSHCHRKRKTNTTTYKRNKLIMT